MLDKFGTVFVAITTVFVFLAIGAFVGMLFLGLSKLVF